MNGKKARELRKLAHSYTKTQPVVKYTADLNGTVELDSCQRLFYKEMKRLYRLRKQGKQATLTF
ncbi:MAG: hypothetical protein GOVbin4162_9 [Prokaryotic dsDNA virus sp.]|nr:MAG: hypothetical protein GOVbin4162_9 [Prokaryotic dsDNA virus sp.]|tara:strand:+ start:3858 stop:4049 length:192 start_codon:yes stop_codon:yes gene_type:complete